MATNQTSTTDQTGTTHVTSTANIINAGASDSPITDSQHDQLGLNDFALALAGFIKTCNTPLTIAIQGEWGTGKTSLMNIVEEKIKNDVIYLKFNTWQYSQFNMQDSLVFSFLTSMNDMLALRAYNTNENTGSESDQMILKPQDIPENDIKEAWAKTHDGLKRFINPARGIIKTIVDKFLGSTAADKIDGIIKVIADDSNDDSDNVNAISSLKSQFEECIKTCINKCGEQAAEKKRCVIFIDDLDRLPPKNAVELLEVIKVFLDCKQCVFVLAIDYSVVANGITAKYGKDFDKNKGKNFFDKIIQLPFKMPVKQYKIDSYVKNLFGSFVEDTIPGEVEKEKLLSEGNVAEDTAVQTIVRQKESSLTKMQDIICKTISNNPRSIKRLYNSFSLTLQVLRQKNFNGFTNNGKVEKEQFFVIFYLHCIQLSNEDMYNHILSYIRDYVYSKLGNQPDNKWIEDYSPENEGDAATIILENFKKYLDDLISKLSNQNPSLSKDEIWQVISDLVFYTSIASTNSGETPLNTDGYMFDGKRYVRRAKDESKRNTSWLGHDIIEKFIRDKQMDENAIREFIKDLKDYKKKHPRDRQTDQGEIIYLSQPEDKNIKTKPIEVKEKGLKIFVIDKWFYPDIVDLVNYIREKYKAEVGVTYNGNKL